jgi:hypothetical protein
MRLSHLFVVGLWVFYTGDAKAQTATDPPAADASDASATPEVEAPRTRVSLSTSETRLGERFYLFVDVTHRPQIEVNLPAALPLGEDFEEHGRESERTKEVDGWVTERFEVALSAFALGDLSLPPLPLTYTAHGRVFQMQTAATTIRVISVVAEGETVLRDIAPPVEVRTRDWTIAYISGGAATALLLAALALITSRMVAARRRRRPAGEVAADGTPLLPAEEEALARLDSLEASGALEADDLKPTHHDMSEIFRNFLGRRFGFSALDLTTAELCTQLRARVGEAGPAEAAESWLEQNDLVKFANQAVTSDEARRALYDVRMLIEQLRRLASVDGGVVASADTVAAEEKVA